MTDRVEITLGVSLPKWRIMVARVLVAALGVFGRTSGRAEAFACSCVEPISKWVVAGVRTYEVKR